LSIRKARFCIMVMLECATLYLKLWKDLTMTSTFCTLSNVYKICYWMPSSGVKQWDQWPLINQAVLPSKSAWSLMYSFGN
jgi:hypothetical protein